MIELKLPKNRRNEYGVANTNTAWQWCIDNLGRPEPYGDRWAWDTNRTFWFHLEADASMFALKFL